MRSRARPELADPDQTCAIVIAALQSCRTASAPSPPSEVQRLPGHTDGAAHRAMQVGTAFRPCEFTPLGNLRARSWLVDPTQGRAAKGHQVRVRCLPDLRHPGASLREPALWQGRPWQASLQPQAARHMPPGRCAPHVADRRASVGSHHCAPACSPRLVAADLAACAIGLAAQAGHPCAAGGAARDHLPLTGWSPVPVRCR